ncbi:hypothetical protein HDU98_002905 [Podochytrium sp. JEL0797]|nr:hypothetical protein HDU98_002905 [Podochytrium sp. JEL0797]
MASKSAKKANKKARTSASSNSPPNAPILAKNPSEDKDSVLHSLLNVSATPSTKPVTFRVQPQSDLLAKVASFLPQLKQANQQLSVDLESGTSTKEDFDIEHVDEDEQHIEMDLGLGVFDYSPEDLHKIPKPDVTLVKKPVDSDADSDAESDAIVSLKLKPEIQGGKRAPNIQILQ